MQMKCCQGLAMILLAMTIASCGGNGGGIIDAPAAPAPVIGDPVAESTDLPDFAGLQGIEREISRVGGGWQELPVSGPGLLDLSTSATPGLDGLLLEADGGTAWFAWGIDGVSDGLYIDAVYLDMADADNEYYIAVSDFSSGRWRTLGPFTGSQEVAYEQPLDCVSPTGRHYFAVIVPAGSQTVEACSFRVGGDNGRGPFPVTMFPEQSGQAVFLSWWHSASYADLDFAGYMVARSPYLEDDFQFLTTEPVMQTQYVDDTVEEGILYRYIVYACDAAGNRTPGPTVSGWLNANGDNPPVIVVEHTPGPLTYPATVRIDLSGSYDPDGDPIEEYEVRVATDYISITQADPVFELELPAGGYRVDVRARNDKYSYSWFPVTVLPAWEDESHVLIESSNTWRRAYVPRLATDPVSGEPIAIYIDTMRSAVVASWVSETGLDEIGSWPIYGQDEVNNPGVYRFISEPVAFGNRLLLHVHSGSYRRSLQLDAGGFSPFAYLSPGGNEEVQADIATDGEGGLWNFLLQGFGTDLVAYQSGGFGGATIHEGVVSPGLLDAEHNASTGMYEIVYTHDGGIMWAVVNPADNDVSKVSLATTDVISMDLEYNPHANKMEVLIGTSTGLYHAARPAGESSWPGFSPVDISGAVTGQVDLVNDADGSYAFAGIDSSLSRIYYKTGAGWTAGQETAWTNGGFELSAIRLAGEGQTLLMDRAIDRLHVLRMGDEFGQAQLATVMGTDYLGLGLTVEDNEDGIYLATRQGLGLSVYGSQSGESWSEYGSGIAIQPEGIRLSTDQTGHPYLNYIFNGLVKEYRYNGVSFELLDAYFHNDGTMPITGGSYNRLFMLDQSDQLGDGSVIYEMEGNKSDRTYVNGPIRDGVLDGYSSNSFSGLVVYGGSTGYNGGIGYLTNTMQDVRFVGYWGGMPFSDPLIIGRTIDSSYGAIPGLQTSGATFYATSSDSGEPIRVTRENYSFRAETVPVSVTDRDMGEMRRIVSADNTPMFCGVALISNLQGEVELFEMSSQSRYVPLEFPDIENGHLYEIVAAQDGRWHIIYRDMVTDDLMIRSTLGPAI